MFAPKSAKSQTKATERPTGKLLPQRSMLAARPLVGGAAEQARLTGNESRRDSERKADPARPIARAATPGASWDFSRIPIYSPERREAAGAQTSSAVSRIPNDSRNSPSLKHREIQIALPPWQRADWTAGSTPKAVSMLGAGRALTAEERKVAADDVPLADVRVHDDSNAQVMTALLGNAGFAAGEHIVLSDAAPSQRRDLLLAHELVHVLQQRATDGRARSPDPEQEAERLAEHSRYHGVVAPGAAPRGFAEAPVVKYTQDLGNDLLLIIDYDNGGFIGGCVRAKVPHLGVKVIKKGVAKSAGNQLFNVHLGITTNAAGETCFFFYESVSGLCTFKCFPTLEELKQSLKDIRDWIEEKIENLLKVLLPLAVAVVIAYIIADAIMVALVAAGILVAA